MKEVRIIDEKPADPEKMQVGHLAEHTETERLESAAEHLSQIKQLRPEVWAVTAYSMSNNYDWIYAGYMKITGSTTITSLSGYFAFSDTTFDHTGSSSQQDIYRLTYTLSSPITLAAGEYWFSHDATLVPEPATLGLLAAGGIATLLRRKRNK